MKVILSFLCYIYCGFLPVTLLRANVEVSISIVLDKNYGKTHAIRLNGIKVSGAHVLRALTDVTSDSTKPVVVLMPEKTTFDGWDDIMAILDKIGYSNVRYFIFSNATQNMTEVDRPHSTVPFSTTPAPRGATKDY